MIIVEVTAEAGRAQECVVYHNAHHRPCPDLSLLRPSPFLRRELYHAAEEVGRTKAMLQQNFNTRSTSRKSSHAYWIRVNCPHRLPDDRTFAAAITTAERHARINRDPLMAAESIYERNKDMFLYFNKPSILNKDANPTDAPDLRFECAIAPKAGLYAAIIYGRRHGLYMDTSWRHKTRYKSPVTILATRNDAGHMVAIAVLVSRRAHTYTYLTFLEHVTRAIEAAARQVASEGPPEAQAAPLLNMDELQEHSKAIVAADFYLPALFMIDGDDAERNAIELMFGPDIIIRCCQFHVIQAVQAQVRRLFPTSVEQEREKKVKKILEMFRRLQRCPSWEEWDTAYNSFKAEVRNYAASASPFGPSLVSDFFSYFDQQWLSDRWLTCVVDLGLPDGMIVRFGARTNNLVEAAFKVFDKTFFHGRINKRDDRLIHIIVKIWFPSYLKHYHSRERPSVVLQRTLKRAFTLWESNAIKPIEPHEQPADFKAIQAFMSLTPMDDGFVKPDAHGVAWDLVYGENDSEGEEETSDADEGADTDEKKLDEKEEGVNVCMSDLVIKGK
ncbi:hypothetical protein L198_01844 [Cryptococcus wingfieldii CBS 7118]|uniref:MULE transposase domain-containing protein n=1 Tax=Cryptococcus wingfieldii CBS 7118 TaxID=1295528 RepID=A0A1E3JWN9_9TREE|nr:hypothetical protein L198_01844 [Cryptococcus wingfieldii CBS 7118]ODO05156.1 hypothetical protein L198_01844 [Cryptococcus wingfieldii CBS 7118]